MRTPGGRPRRHREAGAVERVRTGGREDVGLAELRPGVRDRGRAPGRRRRRRRRRRGRRWRRGRRRSRRVGSSGSWWARRSASAVGARGRARRRRGPATVVATGPAPSVGAERVARRGLAGERRSSRRFSRAALSTSCWSIARASRCALLLGAQARDLAVERVGELLVGLLGGLEVRAVPRLVGVGPGVGDRERRSGRRPPVEGGGAAPDAVADRRDPGLGELDPAVRVVDQLRRPLDLQPGEVVLLGDHLELLGATAARPTARRRRGSAQRPGATGRARARRHPRGDHGA